MSDQITTQELERAAKNVARISEFLAVRRGWVLVGGADEALEDARKAAASLGEYLTALMTARQVEPAAEAPSPPEPLPSDEIGAARIAKFTDFLDQLRQWFAKRGNAEVPAEGEEALRSIHLSLGTACAAINGILAADEAARAAAAAGTAEAIANPNVVVEVDRDARLILEDTSELPILQEFRGVVELTPAAGEILNGFLAENKIELSDYEKRRLMDKVLRWVEATPEGQVLVLKISGIHGRPEPYSSYQARSAAMEAETQTD
ncbi:MAG: hypothetical protein ACC742_15610 [Thermoanaerobaculales bacterium]